MFPALCFHLLILLSRLLCPPSIGQPRHSTPMVSNRVPDFVDDLTPDEIDACNAAFSDAWLKVVNDTDTIANARGFLEEVYRK